MKEGCLTFPFVFLSITRPRKCTIKYEDENGDLQETSLDGMISRIVQHEYDHVLGKNFLQKNETRSFNKKIGRENYEKDFKPRLKVNNYVFYRELKSLKKKYVMTIGVKVSLIKKI